MDSDEDLELVPPSDGPGSPVAERKLKRLKKVNTIGVSPPQSEALDFDLPDGQAVEEPRSVSRSGSEGSAEENDLSSGFDGLRVDEENGAGLVAKRALDFDSVTEAVEGDGEGRSQEMEVGGSGREELEKKRPRSDELLESKENKKKKRAKGAGDEDMPNLPERRTAKERREQLAQLRAESQRLLRETRDAAFKPAPLVKKPISSVLEKIRQRKLEISKKTYVAVDEPVGFSSDVAMEFGSEDIANEERGNDRAVEVESEKAAANDGISDTLSVDEMNNVENTSSHKTLSPQKVDEKPKQAFRAPVDDTQDLFSDSQTSNSKDELAEETPSSPLEEVQAPSLLALNLKLDSAPPDDISSDEEDNDKENIDPQSHGSANLSPIPDGDPVKAFVDEEAEEEDDSDNDLLRFQDEDNEEDEDSEDAEELRDMIATGYEEKQSDIERRMELHQQLIEQQDAANTENLLKKWGLKQRETTLLDDVGSEEDGENDEEEDDENDEEEDEEDFIETAEDLPPINMRLHIKKIKEMIPQMFTDNDDMYISSDDEEAGKKLVEQCLSEKANQQAELLAPTEYARSKEFFGCIKKVNNVPDNRRKAKTSSFPNMLFTGKKGNVSSKSSFIDLGSKCSIPSSRKQGSGILRSFVFEREDSNSRSTIPTAENSSDVTQREHRPGKTGTAKFTASQSKSSSQLRKDEKEASSGAQLLEILRRSSLQTSHCTRNSIVGQTESIFAAFKLEKKSVETTKRANVPIKTL